jgi:hypothetical protein
VKDVGREVKFVPQLCEQDFNASQRTPKLLCGSFLAFALRFVNGTRAEQPQVHHILVEIMHRLLDAGTVGFGAQNFERPGDALL